MLLTSTIISGFTITQGEGTQAQGGGILCMVSSPRVENCHIVNNFGFQELKYGPLIFEQSHHIPYGTFIFNNIHDFYVYDNYSLSM